MMDRRRFLGVSGMTSVGALAPSLALEATRHGLALSFAEERATSSLEEWQEIVWEYGYMYISSPPQQLLQSLTVDMLGLQVALERTHRSSFLAEFQRYGAMLASMMAMTTANVGELDVARRWWRTARRLAEQSGDSTALVWIRGREVVRGLYEGRPTETILRMVDQAEAYAKTASAADRAELMSGKAQTLALAGRRDDALAALDEVRAVYDVLPSEARENRNSIYGWPEDRLRFTESYVHTYLGDTRHAAAAQDAAIRAYPGSYRRGPAQIELQRALWMVNSGDVTSGVEHASTAVQSLPAQDQIRPIVALAQEVLKAVPMAHKKKAIVTEFSDCLALTSPTY